MNNKPNLNKIIADNLDKAKFQSKSNPSLPNDGWLEAYKSGGTYISDSAKATQFGQYTNGGETDPNKPYHPITNPDGYRPSNPLERIKKLPNKEERYEPSQMVNNAKAILAGIDLSTASSNNPYAAGVNILARIANSTGDAYTAARYAMDGQWKNAGVDAGEAILDLIPFRKGTKVINLSKTNNLPGIYNKLSKLDKSINRGLKVGKAAASTDDFMHSTLGKFLFGNPDSQLKYKKGGELCPDGYIWSEEDQDCIPIEYFEDQPYDNSQNKRFNTGIGLADENYDIGYNFSYNPKTKKDFRHDASVFLPNAFRIGANRGSINLSGEYTPGLNWSGRMNTTIPLSGKEGNEDRLTVSGGVGSNRFMYNQPANPTYNAGIEYSGKLLGKKAPNVRLNVGYSKFKKGGGMFPEYHSYAPPRMDGGGEPCYDVQGNIIDCDEKRRMELGPDAYTAMAPFYNTLFGAANKYANKKTGLVSPLNSFRAVAKAMIKHPGVMFMKRHHLPNETENPYEVEPYTMDKAFGPDKIWWPTDWAEPRKEHPGIGEKIGEWFRERRDRREQRRDERFQRKSQTPKGMLNMMRCFGENCYDENNLTQSAYGGDISIPDLNADKWLNKYVPGGVTGDPNQPYHPITNPEGYRPGLSPMVSQAFQQQSSVQQPIKRATGLDYASGDPALRMRQRANDEIEEARRKAAAKAAAERTYVGPARATTIDDDRERIMKNEAFVQSHPYAKMDEYGNVSRAQWDRNMEGVGDKYTRAAKNDKALEHAATAAEIAGYAEGLGALGSLARSAIKKGILKSAESKAFSNMFGKKILMNPEDELKIIQGNYIKDELPKNYILDTDIDKIVNREINWLQSDEYIKRRSAATGETSSKIKKDVDDIINNWKNVKTITQKTKSKSANALGSYDYIKNIIKLDPKLSREKALEVLDHEIKHAFSQLATTGNYKNYPTTKIGNKLTDFIKNSDHNAYLSKPFEQQVRSSRLLDFMENKYGIPRGKQLSIEDINKFANDINPGGIYEKEFQNNYFDILDQLSGMKRADQKLKFKPGNLSNLKWPFKFESQGNLRQNLLNQLNKAYVIPAGIIGAAALKQEKKGGVIKDNRGQWAHPGEITQIGSNRITMQGVPYPVLGVGGDGQKIMMYPEQEYTFNQAPVTEIPMKKSGGQINWLDRYK